MAKPVKIACIGEVMIELVAGQTSAAKLGVGGDTYNTAVYLAKCANSDVLSVSYITALGTDSFSDRIRSAIQLHNISTTHIESRDGMMPGLYAIETDENGERSFSYWRGQAAAKTLFQEPCKVTLKHLLDFDWLYISGISMAILPQETRVALIAFLKEFRKSGGKLAFDSNYRPRLWEDVQTARAITMEMWALSDVALPTLDDEMLLFEDKDETEVLNRITEAGVQFGALKRGADGPLPIGEDVGAIEFCKVSNIVDTTAAGDSFNAAFLAAHIARKPIKDALYDGHKMAAQVIQAPGAIVDRI